MLLVVGALLNTSASVVVFLKCLAGNHCSLRVVLEKSNFGALSYAVFYQY